MGLQEWKPKYLEILRDTQSKPHSPSASTTKGTQNSQKLILATILPWTSSKAKPKISIWTTLIWDLISLISLHWFNTISVNPQQSQHTRLQLIACLSHSPHAHKLKFSLIWAKTTILIFLPFWRIICLLSTSLSQETMISCAIGNPYGTGSKTK